MKIGDKRTETPDFGTSPGFIAKPMPCEVVYIHPKRRYYTVEFRNPVTGLTFRQSYQFRERP